MRYGLTGSTGRMGKEIIEVFKGHDLVLEVNDTGIFRHGEPEVIVDFSNREVLKTTIELAAQFGAGVVIGTTALSQSDLTNLRTLSEKVPVIQSYNFSTGINIMKMILREFSPLLKDFEAELIETHHSGKKDAPSGTALMLKDATERDLPIHSLRVGGVPGDHSIVFANEGEVIEITHRAISRKVFAIGALTAARFCLEHEKGFYSFEEVIRWTQR
ncbi:MAG TPA: dihydrodipicolinate reductase C-terminal domain-containing protein [Mesotoga prima]|uniref:4-hydroxy-tetrahydrodipicolinate reductase n=1 Tax=Mesotoga prima TaxID=1184387 RepID=UPI002BB2B01F|nr:dihydrodipicolinate reductase C-terminal domain-containing protein [Mesotoga prima]HPE54186.1 dihydrodipicolinate reductase C-terminal domain-containing protein [Mesotoga prima]